MSKGIKIALRCRRISNWFWLRYKNSK